MGNFLVVTAFKFTTITHVRIPPPKNTPNSRNKCMLPQVQLLDCFSVPCVIALSYLLPQHRYTLSQLAGALCSVAGALIVTLYH